MGERRRILMTMLDAIYVDPQEKSIVAIRPKPTFQALFEIAATREGSSDVALIKEEPPADGQEAPCLWWSRIRVELPLKRGPVIWVAKDWSAEEHRGLEEVGRPNHRQDDPP